MKNILFLIIFGLGTTLSAQTNSASKVGWFMSPEFGGIFHGGDDSHVGVTAGTSLGVKLFRDHLKVGMQFYGRSGPLNPYEFRVEATGGQVYKGSTTLNLRGDHGVFGLFLAPSFNIKKVGIDFPIGLGQMGGGFYLTGEDRETPDGRRVSEWEDQLMDGMDAGFSSWFEFGTRVFIPLRNDHFSIGAGLHYTIAPQWSTYADPNGSLYNNRLRFSVVFNFESRNAM